MSQTRFQDFLEEVNTMLFADRLDMFEELVAGIDSGSDRSFSVKEQQVIRRTLSELQAVN